MISPVEEKYTFNQWRLTTNEIITTMGDLLNLQTTEKTTVVGALNELDDAVKGRYGIEYITDFDKQHPLSVTRINATGSAPNNSWGATLLQRTATGTTSIPTAPIANTTMGGIVVEGYSGAQWGVSSKIVSIAPANWSPTSQPSGWKMYTTDINSINLTLALELFPSGRVGIHGPLDDGVNELQVNGTIKATSIESTPIGAVTPASATFTTANATLFNGSGAGLTSIPNGALVNSTITVGSTIISLGGTSTVLAGLTSVTSTSFVGALTGNASSATILQTTRAINGVNFNGSAAITVPVNTTNDTTTATTVYPTFVPLSTAGNQSIKTSSTKLSFVPSTGILTATGFAGNGASLTSLDAGNISTGILSTARGGTGTSSITGTGSNVFSISPELTGIPTAPTAIVADTSQQIATTAFVKAVLTAGAAAGASYGGDVSIAPLVASSLLHLNKPLGIYSAAIKFEDQGIEKFILGYSSIGSAGVSDFSLYNLVPVTPVNVLTVFGATSNVAIGGITDNGYKLDVTGTARVSGDLTVDGGLTVNGTVTTINSTQIQVDDINIELGAVTTPTDTTANGGGITLLGSTNKTFNWSSTGANWTSSENISLATGKVFKINNVSVLSNTTLGSTVVTSSLTSVGTLTGGTWHATVIAGQYGGTGVANTGKTITLGGNLITSGAFATTLTVTAATNITLPTTGTLSTLAEVETLTNKTISGATNTLSAIANSSLTNSTISGIALGGTLATLTAGSYLVGTSYNGSIARTWSVDATALNTASKIVARDASGNFAAGTITATLSGTASVASTVTLTADNTTNATNYPLFANAATGDLSPRTDTGFTYNPSTGVLTSTSFAGSGASLTALNGTNITTGTIANGRLPVALSGKTYEGLTLTSASVGFDIAGGTTSKTLTVSNTLTLAGTDGSTLNISTGGTLGSAAFTAATDYATAAHIHADYVPFAMGAVVDDANLYLSNQEVGLASTSTNTPVAVAGTLSVMRGSNTNNLTQTFQPVQIQPELYIRTKSGGTWGTWERLTRASELGTGAYVTISNYATIASLGTGAYATIADYALLASPTFTGIILATGTTVSSSKTTGALVVTGGVGIGGALNVGGDVTAFAASDSRLKTNIQRIDDALNKVCSLSGNTFNWNQLADGKDINIREVGVIAQEVQAVLPEVVVARDNGYLAVQYEKMIPLLIEAIKELKAEIDMLKGTK